MSYSQPEPLSDFEFDAFMQSINEITGWEMLGFEIEPSTQAFYNMDPMLDWSSDFTEEDILQELEQRDLAYTNTKTATEPDWFGQELPPLDCANFDWDQLLFEQQRTCNDLSQLIADMSDNISTSSPPQSSDSSQYSDSDSSLPSSPILYDAPCHTPPQKQDM